MINAVVGDAGANSYVDVTYADEFFANSVNNSSWPTLPLDKERALIESTRIIDSQFDWNGLIVEGVQALRWPRELAYDMVYGAEPTPFMRMAAAAGAKSSADGLGMLVGQAAVSYQWWRGFQPDTQTVLAAMRASLCSNH